MAGLFILSLDCEGNWGIADQPPDKPWLTRAQLEDAYQKILAVLDLYAIPATFAFVGGFAATRKIIDLPEFEALAVETPYVRCVQRAIDRSDDGWTGDWALDAVARAHTRHELALHGMTHTPWSQLSAQSACLELSMQRHLSFASKTFIYPRNDVAHIDVLGAHGYAGYRDARQLGSRIRSFLSEFQLRIRAEFPSSQAEPVAIPAGYFVNWQRGARRLVPMAVTRRRASNLLDDAARRGGVAHYWTHPENVATAPETMRVLEDIVALVARRRDRGEVSVVTQIEYCQHF